MFAGTNTGAENLRAEYVIRGSFFHTLKKYRCILSHMYQHTSLLIVIILRSTIATTAIILSNNHIVLPTGKA